MEAITKIHAVLRQGLRYSFDADYNGSLRALAIKTVNKLDRAEYNRNNTRQIAGHRQVMPVSFNEVLSRSYELKKRVPALSSDKLHDRRLRRWYSAYQLTIQSRGAGNFDNAIGGLKDRAYSEMLDQVADDCQGSGEGIADSLFHLAVITEILGNDSPWRLKDAKAYWCSLLAKVLDRAYSRLKKQHYDWSTDYVLIAMASLARLERRMGNQAEAVALLQTIAGSNLVVTGDKWAQVGAETIPAGAFLSALANPHVFDQIDPIAWHTYVLNR